VQSFARPLVARSRRPVLAPTRDRPGDPEVGIPVGPGRPVVNLGEVVMGGGQEIDPLPVQQGKVQPPLLPEETLRRDRLLDWLHVRIHSRLVLVVADAGYGKTTLLGDFTRRSRVRSLWYRLDEDDRDGVVLLHHLVAAGREHDPDFAPTTRSLLREIGAGTVDFATTLAAFLNELKAWTTGATALVLDDYHVVDDVTDVREVVRALLTRGPDRLAVVIATRRRPSLPLARLRALGEVAELSTDDLRFDIVETERLFRETYRQPLEADVLAELARHTDGWAATLRLVHTAVRGQSREEVRRLVRELSGHRGDLHDYLAEEVVGQLDPAFQAFVERCSLLGVVTPELAAAASGATPDEARARMDTLEERGLMSRRGRSPAAGRQFHPLVRDFLIARLRDEIGDDGVAEVHARIAAAAESTDWAVSAHHYAAAARPGDLARVLERSTPAILGSGAYARAEELARALPPELAGPWLEVIVARHELKRGDTEAGRQRALALLDLGGRGTGAVTPLALNVLITAAHDAGDFTDVVRRSRQLQTSTDDPGLTAIARAAEASAAASVIGDLVVMAAAMRDSAAIHLRLGHRHYYGISMLNLGWAQRAQGDVEGAEESAREALLNLKATSSGPEVATALVVISWALAHRGDLGGLSAGLREAASAATPAFAAEIAVESADIVSTYCDPTVALTMLNDAAVNDAATPVLRSYRDLVAAETLSRLGRLEEAQRIIAEIPEDLATGYPGFQTRVILSKAIVAALRGDQSVAALAESATQRALVQHAGLMLDGARLLLKLLDPVSGRSDNALRECLTANPAVVSNLAETVVQRIAALADPTLWAVAEEASRRPKRWLPALRRAVSNGRPADRHAAARLLERIGTVEDVPRLRALSRELKGEHRDPELGRALARRVAPRVFVEDQGRVVVGVGDRLIPGTEIRRKVLALLCFLLAQPGLSATRDGILEALWPEADPDQALNSLHQTAYFLRRVFEPAYKEDLSPGYLHHEVDVVWLDPDLVDSRSLRCGTALRSLGPAPGTDDVDRIAAEYRGRFALDFAYEDWASHHRETMHARYLELMERAVTVETDAGHVDRAIRLAQRALDVDPEAEQLEVCLLRLYRMTGAHAAAAEQYAHYASVMRDQLGIEPPALEDL